MITILFILISLILSYMITHLAKLLLQIVSDMGLNKRYSKYPLEKSISYMIILGIISTAFLFGISFPFTSRTGFNLDNIELSLSISLISCIFITIGIFLFIYISKKIENKVPYIPYSALEDFEFNPYARLHTSLKTKIYWLVYRWTIPGIVKEILFRGIILTILDVGISGYINIFGLFNLGYSVIIAQVIYQLAHIKIRFKPFRIKVSMLEQISLIPLGLITGVLYYYTLSLIGPIIIHSFYSGYGAILYMIFRKKKKSSKTKYV